MPCTVEEFRLRIPAFSDAEMYCDALVQIKLDDAALTMGEDEICWCGKYDRAQCYLAAHLMSVSEDQEFGDASSTAGPITSKSAGGVSLSTAGSSVSKDLTDEFYSTTSYGTQFMIDRNSCFSGAWVLC